MSSKLEKCKTGNHDFVSISMKPVELGSQVVNWCKECGSISVDHYCDGREYPGYYAPIRKPNLIDDYEKGRY